MTPGGGLLKYLLAVWNDNISLKNILINSNSLDEGYVYTRNVCFFSSKSCKSMNRNSTFWSTEDYEFVVTHIWHF